MKFTRINENTVNCIITAEDMDEQGLSIEDLFHKKDEAMEFLREVISRAAEEVDYHPNGMYLPMQMTVLPDHSISLTLSEDASSSIPEMLRDLAEKLRVFLEDISSMHGTRDTGAVDAAQGKDVAGTDVDSAAKRTADMAGRLSHREFVFSFDSMHTVIRFAKSLFEKPCVRSSLFKDTVKDVYYLYLTPFVADGVIMDVGEDHPDLVRALLFMHANEYGTFVTAEKRFILFMQENMECIIPNDALERLADL